MFDLSKYVQDCLRTESNNLNITPLNSQEYRVAHAVLGIVDESGELAKALKARMWYGKPLDVINLQEEVSDVLWYVSLLLDAIGSSYEEVMTKNIAKLRVRYPEKFTTELALNRDLDNERQALEAWEQ